MAKVLLIDPPFAAFMEFSRWFYPFGLAVLARDLEQYGHEVLVYDCDHIDSSTCYTYRQMLDAMTRYQSLVHDGNHPAYTDLKKTVVEFDPDVVGLTCMSVKMPAVFQIARLVKNWKPVPVICGGAHASELPEHCLESPHIDYVIRRDGRTPLALLIDAIGFADRPGLSTIAGLSYQGHEGEFVHNPVSYSNSSPRNSLPRDLSPRGSLPGDFSSEMLPDRSKLKAPHPYTARDMSLVMASVGCPSGCTFCAKTLRSKPCFRSLDSLDKEIRSLIAEYGVEFIHFKDDSFTIDKTQVAGVCRILKSQSEIKGWECLTRIDMLDRQTLELMKDSKCSRVKVGVESGSDRILANLHKGITTDDVISFAQEIRCVGLPWSMFLMIGLPGETISNIEETQEIIKRAQPDHVSISVFAPYPGSKLYSDLRRAGALKEPIKWEALDPFALEAQFERAIPEQEFREVSSRLIEYVDDYNAASSWSDI